MSENSKNLAETKRLMGALVRMKPKPHEDMKIGNRSAKSVINPAKKKDKMGGLDDAGSRHKGHRRNNSGRR